jgi:MarR family transcriptional regulator, transcriptional regulator for hemolysin
MPKKEVSIFELKEFSYGRKFNLLGKLYLSILAEHLAHLGLERHFSVLVLLNETGDECCQRFIADTLHIDKATMVGVLDDLSKKGFIKRTQNPSDRREYHIILTKKGKESMPEIIATVNRLNKSIMQKISSPEIDKLDGQLDTIYKNLLAITDAHAIE